MTFLCFDITYVGFINRRIKKFLEEGSKISAIKLYWNHKRTIGLKRAKEYVDRIEHRMFLKGELETSFINRCENHENISNCY